MKNKLLFFFTLSLVGALIWREYTRADAIAWAIQDTSDELLAVCETKIDELNTQNAQEYARGFNACLAQAITDTIKGGDNE